jgi:DNA-binding NarL/FixJ family response regulator
MAMEQRHNWSESPSESEERASGVPSSRAPAPKVAVGSVAEHESLRVIKPWIGGEEFAVLSFADNAAPSCKLSHPEGARHENPPLTDAEQVIAALALAALANRAIAEKRGTSPSTIGNQLAAI